MGGLLLPRAAPPLLPRAARRWEALAAAAPLLLHPITRVWRSGRRLLLLRHAWVTPPRPPQATMMSALTSERWAHMNTASRFQLFSIITKCIRSFLDSKVRKQFGFCWERTSAGEEGQCCTNVRWGPKLQGCQNLEEVVLHGGTRPLPPPDDISFVEWLLYVVNIVGLIWCCVC
jgi:hypothetical protein